MAEVALVLRGRVLKVLLWVVAIPLAAPLIYAVAAFGASLLAAHTAIPDAGAPIYACDNGVHTDFVMPVEFAGHDWRAMFDQGAFTGPIDGYDHLSIGWGSRDFYINTPTWADVRIATALKSLLWDETVLHVQYRPRPAAAENCRQWRADSAAQDQAALLIWQSLRLSGLRPVQAAPGYGDRDVFFVANGRYTIFDTCNQWTGRVLRAAGAPVAPWTPFSFLVLWNLPMISS